MSHYFCAIYHLLHLCHLFLWDLQPLQNSLWCIHRLEKTIGLHSWCSTCCHGALSHRPWPSFWVLCGDLPFPFVGSCGWRKHASFDFSTCAGRPFQCRRSLSGSASAQFSSQEAATLSGFSSWLCKPAQEFSVTCLGQRHSLSCQRLSARSVCLAWSPSYLAYWKPYCSSFVCVTWLVVSLHWFVGGKCAPASSTLLGHAAHASTLVMSCQVGVDQPVAQLVDLSPDFRGTKGVPAPIGIDSLRSDHHF